MQIIDGVDGSKNHCSQPAFVPRMGRLHRDSRRYSELENGEVWVMPLPLHHSSWSAAIVWAVLHKVLRESVDDGIWVQVASNSTVIALFNRLGEQRAPMMRYRTRQANEGLMERDDVSVSVFPMYGYSVDAIDALESALEEQFGTVEITRDIHPAGGAAEMFFTIAAAGSGIYATAFLATLGSEHAKALNAAIISALKRGRDRQGRPRSVPLRIDVGGIRLYFRHLDSEAVLRERAQAALPLLEASLGSPPEYTPATVRPDGVDIPPIEGRGYYWDVQSSSWQRAPVDWVGEVCPRDAG